MEYTLTIYTWIIVFAVITLIIDAYAKNKRLSKKCKFLEQELIETMGKWKESLSINADLENHAKALKFTCDDTALALKIAEMRIEKLEAKTKTMEEAHASDLERMRTFEKTASSEHAQRLLLEAENKDLKDRIKIAKFIEDLSNVPEVDAMVPQQTDMKPPELQEDNILKLTGHHAVIDYLRNLPYPHDQACLLMMESEKASRAVSSHDQAVLTMSIWSETKHADYLIQLYSELLNRPIKVSKFPQVPEAIMSIINTPNAGC